MEDHHWDYFQHNLENLQINHNPQFFTVIQQQIVTRKSIDNKISPIRKTFHIYLVNNKIELLQKRKPTLRNITHITSH